MVTVPSDPLPDWSDGVLWRAALDRWLSAAPQSAARSKSQPSDQTEDPKCP
ncbi:MAG: hypothetical protein OEU09_20595 [Rhodospirillales bacterium]|nr:hypothetical protein [Rhodospirillales bacterium]